MKLVFSVSIKKNVFNQNISYQLTNIVDHKKYVEVLEKNCEKILNSCFEAAMMFQRGMIIEVPDNTKKMVGIQIINVNEKDIRSYGFVNTDDFFRRKLKNRKLYCKFDVRLLIIK